MKEELIETIENQIKNKKPKSTYNAYHTMLDNNINDDESKEFLASLLEFHVRKMYIEEKEFDEEEWKEDLKYVTKCVLEDIKKDKIDDYHLEKNISRVKKECGYIIENKEDDYYFELNTIETTLYSYYLVYEISSKDAKKIIMQLINILYGYIHQQNIDFFTDEDKKIYIMTKFLEEKCNPYLNDNIKEIIKDQIEIKHENDFEIFKPMLKCLERIYRSIIFWDKRLGTNGYFEFLESVEDSLGNSYSYSAYTETTFCKKG